MCTGTRRRQALRVTRQALSALPGTWSFLFPADSRLDVPPLPLSTCCPHRAVHHSLSSRATGSLPLHPSPGPGGEAWHMAPVPPASHLSTVLRSCASFEDSETQASPSAIPWPGMTPAVGTYSSMGLEIDGDPETHGHDRQHWPRPEPGTKPFLQVSHVGAIPLLLSQVQQQVAGLEAQQLGLQSVPVWDTGTTGG